MKHPHDIKGRWHVVADTKGGEADFYVHHTDYKDIEALCRKDFGDSFIKLLLVEPI